jgi:hypothetical protein
MPRYWVVSANVNNKPGTLRKWIAAILRNKSAYMGWEEYKPTGAVFKEIARGDIVLICYGSLANHGAGRRLVACGRVVANIAARDPRVGELGGQNQFVTLTQFRPLDEDPKKYVLLFKDTFCDNNPQPPAVFEIKRRDSDHPGNAKLCEWLHRVLKAKSVTGPGTAKKPSGAVVANSVTTDGEENTEGYEVKTKKQIIQAEHRENKLVTAFRRSLEKKGRETTRLRYVAGDNVLYCDIYEPKKKHLLEAKGSCSREDVRMAIGQLLDYGHLTKAAALGDSKLAILLPERPNDDIVTLLKSIDADIALVWKQGRAFVDNRHGKFA